jgi:hypothetical protein
MGGAAGAAGTLRWRLINCVYSLGPAETGGATTGGGGAAGSGARGAGAAKRLSPAGDAPGLPKIRVNSPPGAGVVVGGGGA